MLLSVLKSTSNWERLKNAGCNMCGCLGAYVPANEVWSCWEKFTAWESKGIFIARAEIA